MPLTVLNVGYPLARVSEDAVGGAEQVLAALDRALVNAGHRSLVVAAAGSKVSGELIPTPLPHGPLDEQAREGAQRATASAIRTGLDRCSVDVVHLHGVDFPRYLPPPGVPVLATLHLPPSWYPAETFAINRAETWLQCVSLAQHRVCPPAGSLLRPIANGVDLQRLHPRYHKRRFALALGRICPEKGMHHALDAAQASGVPLYLAGEIYSYPEHESYFEQELRPRLQPPHRFLGPLRFARKQRILRAARCVLIPSLVPETSSLVAMEALACGTPVIAFRTGALPEIVAHGESGFLVADQREMAEAIRWVERIDPRDCRRAAECRFDVRHMIQAYFDVYQQLSRRSVARQDRDHQIQFQASEG